MILRQMNAATTTSSMLKGIANRSNLNGSTFRFPITSHMSRNPNIQDSAIVSIIFNLLLR